MMFQSHFSIQNKRNRTLVIIRHRTDQPLDSFLLLNSIMGNLMSRQYFLNDTHFGDTRCQY